MVNFEPCDIEFGVLGSGDPNSKLDGLVGVADAVFADASGKDLSLLPPIITARVGVRTDGPSCSSGLNGKGQNNICVSYK